LSKAFLVLIFKAWRIMVNRRAGFLVNNKGDRSFFFCLLVVTFWPVVLSLFSKQ